MSGGGAGGSGGGVSPAGGGDPGRGKAAIGIGSKSISSSSLLGCVKGVGGSSTLMISFFSSFSSGCMNSSFRMLVLPRSFPG